MNALATSLNEAIQAVNPHVYEMLSNLGRSLYFPKGILSQSAEAKAKATRFNVTIGTAMSEGDAMFLPSVMSQLPSQSANDALLYAPAPGLPALRRAWQEKNLHDNPSLRGVATSLPIVTSGLTHGLGLLADMFANPGEHLIYPDMNWGNYALNFVVRKGMKPCLFSFFKEGGFNIAAFRQALKDYSMGQEKVIVLLNFPNNPSGYTPTEDEGNAIADALVELAESGVNVVAIVDDAYFGLFFDDVMQQSLFTKLAGRHERLLAVKADAATKEVYVWGLRVGFVTIAVKSDTDPEPLYQAMNAKFGGCIRSQVSSGCALSQQVVLRGLQSPTFYEERAANVAVMRERARKVREVLDNPKYSDAWEVYPFNSGYFMCLKLKDVDAEALRVHLLDKYGVGTIAVATRNLRVAFSCLETEHVQELFDLVYAGCKDLA